ncbi:PAS domain S-box protein [Duganella violaceipulchra]|uniref:Sensor protein FixL n=1 Tax=Duganella violaceipulchra TaxID=2849652 RepID=A0AA41HF90_9BURK|nr:PAS domain S-box protein [Duganella violaceicalia]MBV6325636.1 PAS domain S-box protein [Duganella violaceicalia]MCP2012790.1 PAS domain S-box-containing protein [Duganella violaceicalia]
MISALNHATENVHGLRRLALMIDSVSDAIVTIDSRGIIEYANRGAQELFGYRLEELLGHNVSMLMPQPDSNRHDAYISSYLRTGQSRVMNHRRSVNGLRRDGSLVPLDLTLGQMLEDGEKKFTAVLRDVTEQRRLQQLAAETERALQNAKNRADEANRAKSIFLATMSHEIRTPMNGVLGSLELLGLTELTESQHETVAMAEQSGRELLRLLDDILDFSKIEAGRLELRHERTAIRENIIEKVVATYAPLASKKGIELRSRVDPSTAQRFCTDPLRLRQILHNFVSNAVKFTLAGSIELSLDVIRTEPGAQVLRFSVRDTGIGISAASQARLFRPFVQADGDTTRRFGGTGLGLAICLGLAESMGGTIAMESVLGLGTTMSLELSLPTLREVEVNNCRAQLRNAPSINDPQVRHRAAPPVTTAASSGTLVLVVDDHATNRNVLVRQLASLGYAAESAINGVDALEKLATRRYSLLISDCQMPEMDGYTLARTIRDDEWRRGISRLPIIAFTANAFASDATRALVAGMDDYLSKPTTLASLSSLLERYLPLPPPETNMSKSSEQLLAFRDRVIDETHLAQIVGDDLAERAALLSDFKESCDIDAKALEAAYQTGELHAFMEIAHRICGASKMVGASGLAAACRSIESCGRERLALSNDSGHVDALGISTREAYRRFQAELDAFDNYLKQGTACLKNVSPAT